jgi:hypothetical protein
MVLGYHTAMNNMAGPVSAQAIFKTPGGDRRVRGCEVCGHHTKDVHFYSYKGRLVAVG